MKMASRYADLHHRAIITMVVVTEPDRGLCEKKSPTQGHR